MTTPSGRISNEPEERKKDRKRKEQTITFIVATYVYASSQGQRTHSARTKISEIRSLKTKVISYSGIPVYDKTFCVCWKVS